MRDDREATPATESESALYLMMERDEDENEERGQMGRRHRMVVKRLLMLSGGLAGVCGPTGQITTFWRVGSASTEK